MKKNHLFPRILGIGFSLILFLAFSLSSLAQKTAKLKIYISADMEGISGIVHADQTSSESREYAEARKWMADDVNAAVAGAFLAGATEVVVNDAHGSQRNIDPADLDSRAVLISGSPKPFGMMQGIDSSYNAVILIGYHARAGTQDAILDHTISGSVVRAVRINEAELPELGINAALAGFYGVPVVLISGDVAVCQQAKDVLGNEVVTVPVKDAIGRTAARLVPLAEAHRTIKNRVTEALKKLGQFKPYLLNPPCRFELELFNSAQADLAAMIPTVKRLNPRAVSFTADDYSQGYRLLRALITIASR
jgi:D-amino peptidase